jgi:hypothetical protein
MTRVALAVGLAAFVTASPIAAQPPRAPEPDIEIWFAEAWGHQPGMADRQLTTVMGWPRKRLDKILQIALQAPDPPRLWRALSLHTDIAIAEFGQPSSAAGETAIEVMDGRQVRVLGRSFHWAIARQIAAVLAGDPGGAPSVAAWYRATSATLQELAACDLLEEHLAAAHKVVGRDPLLALYQGTLHQTYADARLQRYARQALAGSDLAQRTAIRAGGSTGFRGAHLTGLQSRNAQKLPRLAGTELGDAERWLRRALALDPTLVEARIRLAHVLVASGESAQAAELVRPVVETPLPRFSAYYAALILGRSEEQLAHYPEADAAYARAAALFPGAQSVEIGRSRVALAQGRAAQAVAAVVGVAGPGSPEPDDPWMWYFRMHDPRAQALLDAWRSAAK